MFRKWESTARVQGGSTYWPVAAKMTVSLILAVCWLAISVIVAHAWIDDLTTIVPVWLAWVIVTALAFVPGIANVFIVIGLLVDNRPQYPQVDRLPDVSILIAAYNEADFIRKTLESVLEQQIPCRVETIIVNDGSTDDTAQVVSDFAAKYSSDTRQFRLVDLATNQGKAMALNAGLPECSHEYVVTLDADCLMYEDSLRFLVTNIVSGPSNTAAVAGSVLVRNSRHSVMTRLQEWDYFHGIAVVKRIQSLYQGTLVAQGAYSVFQKSALEAIGGWKDTIGEDIVLTWGLRAMGYRVGYCENAIVFTNVPTTYQQFFRQRRRWARGLIEAFRTYPQVITRVRMNTPFIWYNVLFPYLDVVYLFVFIPGVIAAIFFQHYAVAGLITLLLLPFALAINMLMYSRQRKIFKKRGLRVRNNLIGFFLYVLTYQAVMTPASVAGYFAEILHFRKSWGTK